MSRIIAVLIFAAAGFYIGGLRMSPVIAISLAAGVDSLLSLRIKNAGPRIRFLRKALIAFFTAEVFCFIGTYLFWREGFLLVHDGFHVLAAYFVFLTSLDAAAAAGGAQSKTCFFRCCENQKNRGSGDCLLDDLLSAGLWGGLLLSMGILFVWSLDVRLSFLTLPQAMTKLGRTIDIAVFPGIAVPLFLFLIFQSEIRKKDFVGPRRSAFALGLALVGFSFFQLTICTVKDSLAVFVEEFFEFFPMILIFHLLIARTKPVSPNSGNGRSTASSESVSVSTHITMLPKQSSLNHQK